jgi:hypothetical protein
MPQVGVKDRVVKAQIPHQLLQPPVLPLQILQPFGLFDAHAPVDLARTVVGLTGNRELAAYRLKTLALAEEHLRFS